MYTDHTILQTIGQLLIAFLFVGTALINASTKFCLLYTSDAADE